MATYTANINIRRDTAANFTSANPTLQLGEIAYETDTGNFKVGNGSTAWTSLAYSTPYKSTAACESTNVGIGTSAASKLAAGGVENTAVGNQALLETTTSDNNTAVGSRAGKNITGNSNTCIGMRAGEGIGTGSENVYIGYLTGVSAGTSNSNTAVGAAAGLSLNSSSSANVFVGKDAGFSATSMSNSVAVGLQALGNASTASLSNLTAVGSQALRFTQTGIHTAVGSAALYNNTSGTSNTAVGFQALKDNTTGSYNTAIGNQALVANQTGTRNVAVGEYAMDGNRGDDNVAVGINAGYRKWGGNDNIIIGDYAASGEPSGDNLSFSISDSVVIGSGAYLKPAGTTASPTVTFSSGTPGKVNRAGHGLAANTVVSFTTSGTLPSGIAANTSYFVRNPGTNDFEISLTSGGTSINLTNTGSGTHKVIYAVAGGNGNTVIGRAAGAIMTTGANNVLLGNAAGDLLTTGSTNICIGHNTDLDTATDSNQINIGGVYFHNRLITTPLTKAQLDALPNPAVGLRAFCTDATSTTFASALTGLGSNNVPVYYDGAWKIG